MFRFLRILALLPVLFFTSNLMAAGYMCTADIEYVECDSGYYLTKSGVGNSCESCTDVANSTPVTLETIANGVRRRYCPGTFTGGTSGANGVSQCTGCSEDYVYACECNAGYHDDGNGESCTCVADSTGVCTVTSLVYSTCNAGYYLSNDRCLSCTSERNANTLSTVTISNGTRSQICRGNYTGGTAGANGISQCSGCSESEWVISCDTGYVPSGSGSTATCVEAVGYSCPELKKYSSCASGYYMATKQSDGTYGDFGVVQSGNECVTCPAGWECDGGTTRPYVMVTPYVKSAKDVAYVAAENKIKVYYNDIRATDFQLITTAPVGYRVSDWRSGQDCAGVSYVGWSGVLSGDNWDVPNPVTKLYACYEAQKVYLELVDPLGAYVTEEPEPGDPIQYYWAEYDSTNAGWGYSGGYINEPLPIPSKEGYIFNGWYYKAACDTATDCTASECCDSTKYFGSDGKLVRTWDVLGDNGANVKLYARWSSQIILDASPSSFNNMGTHLAVYPMYGCGLGSQAITVGGSEQYALQERPGYTFGGFYTGQNCTGTQAIDGTGKQLHNNTLSNSTLYACWTVNEYTMTLDPNGGTGGDTSITVAYDTPAVGAVVSNLPTRVGYEFYGYYTGNECNGTRYFEPDGESSRVWDLAENATLYACWNAKSYMVIVDPNGGTVSYSTTALTYNSMSNLSGGYIPQRTGYTFQGYDSLQTCDGTRYWNADGQALVPWDIDADQTVVYACWTPNTYTVTLDYQGATVGAPDVTSLTATYGAPLDVDGHVYARKAGYRMQGFYTQPDCAGSKYINTTASGAGYCSPDMGCLDYQHDLSPNGNWDIAGNTTLYACWAPQQYIVEYSCDGSAGSPDSTRVTVTMDTEFTPDNSVCGARTGYTLAGWDVYMTRFGTSYDPVGTETTDAFTWKYGDAPGNEYMLVPKWTIKSDINVPVGSYLPMGTETPVTCKQDNYCPGMQNVTFSVVADQGLTQCLTNYHTDGTGASAKTDCKISCAGGYYLKSVDDTTCTAAGEGNWVAAAKYGWGQSGTVTACTSGETTIGFGPGADEAADCGRIFHAGDNKLYLRSAKRTTPSLNVLVDGKQYYGNMSDYTDTMTKEQARMSCESDKMLRITVDEKEYWVHDDSRDDDVACANSKS